MRVLSKFLFSFLSLLLLLCRSREIFSAGSDIFAIFFFKTLDMRSYHEFYFSPLPVFRARLASPEIDFEKTAAHFPIREHAGI